MDFRILSIGALSVHELWERQGPARTPHATTTLIEAGHGRDARRIVVDPGLPPAVVAARLSERAGLTPDDVSDVFLTSFRPAHRAGLAAFPDARWLIAERERETVGVALVAAFERAEDEEDKAAIRGEIALLKRFRAADDRIAEGVDLFPLPGFTPGTCGLLLVEPTRTTLIAGDAVATSEHLDRGRVLRGAADVEAAKASLGEAVEIADVIVPGHDNVVLNPTRRAVGRPTAIS